MIRLLTCLLFLSIGIGSTLNAQTAAQILEHADLLFKHGRYLEALDNYDTYLAVETPEDQSVYIHAAVASLQLNYMAEARVYLDHVKKSSNYNPDLFYYYGRYYHKLGDYEKAITEYKTFLKLASPNHPFFKGVVDQIKRCGEGLAQLGIEPLASIRLLSPPINTIENETHPVPSPTAGNFGGLQKFYFSSDRKGATGGQRDDNRRKNDIIGHELADIYAWDVAAGLDTFSGLINSAQFDAIECFDFNGQVMYYLQGKNEYFGQIYVDSFAFTPEQRLTPQPFKSPLQEHWADQGLMIYYDSLMLFSSARPGGFGGLDLYASFYVDGQYWSKPVNLGPSINSIYDEVDPFLSNSTQQLFFSSNRTNSFGGFDLFKSNFDAHINQWTVTEHLGPQINSPGDDRYFQLLPDGQHFLFASNRVGGIGQMDIYEGMFTLALNEHLSIPNFNYARQIAGLDIALQTAPKYVQRIGNMSIALQARLINPTPKDLEALGLQHTNSVVYAEYHLPQGEAILPSLYNSYLYESIQSQVPSNHLIERVIVGSFKTPALLLYYIGTDVGSPILLRDDLPNQPLCCALKPVTFSARTDTMVLDSPRYEGMCQDGVTSNWTLSAQYDTYLSAKIWVDELNNSEATHKWEAWPFLWGMPMDQPTIEALAPYHAEIKKMLEGSDH